MTEGDILRFSERLADQDNPFEHPIVFLRPNEQDLEGPRRR